MPSGIQRFSIITRVAILKSRKENFPPLFITFMTNLFSQGNHEAVVQRLLRHGSTVDCRTADLLTPLHIAAHCGHRKTAELLLKEGADVDACALNGFTPLHVACKKNRFEMVKFLIEKNANTTISTESGLTALMVAAYVDKAGFKILTSYSPMKS